jgi:hypothetical protein
MATTQKLGKAKSLFFCYALLVNEIYIIDISYSFRVRSSTKFKVSNWIKGNNSKNMLAELQFICFALLLNTIYLPARFLIDKVSELRPGRSSKCKNKQRTITLNLGKADIQLLHCTFSQRHLSTFTVSCWELLWFQSYVPDNDQSEN